MYKRSLGRTSFFPKFAVLAALLALAPAASSFPGGNGQIAFVSGRDGTEQIYIMQPDTTGQTQLTSGAAQNIEPSWSPDGRRIAFVGVGGGFDQVFVMNSDGSGRTQLTTDTSNDDWPTWSPDGQKIAFVKNFGTQSSGIWVMNTDGSSQTQLTASGDKDPAWSPDGTRIAFASQRNGNEGIFVMNADGSGITQLAAGTCSGAMQEPSWSPDGAKIAFSCVQLFADGSVHSEIVVMASDGSNPTGLTSDANDYFGPTWSPDGTKIIFWDRSQDLFQVNSDGTGLTQFTTDTLGYAQPNWQPVASADVALDLAVATVKAKGKTTLTYTITLANAGPSWANGVLVSDQLPAGTTFASADSSQGTCQTPAVGSTGTLTCSIGSLASGVGATVQLIVRVTLKGKGSISDTATVNSTTPDPNGANNTKTVNSTA